MTEEGSAVLLWVEVAFFSQKIRNKKKSLTIILRNPPRTVTRRKTFVRVNRVIPTQSQGSQIDAIPSNEYLISLARRASVFLFLNLQRLCYAEDTKQVN